MLIEIRSKGFSVTEALDAHARRRLYESLRHHRGRVNRISLRLSDDNGPRGGIDKRCTIEVRVRGADPIVTQALEVDAYLSIDRASERAGRAIGRRLARRSRRRTAA